MANVYDIEIEQGATLDLTLAAKDELDAPLNLQGYVASGNIKYQYGDTNALLPLDVTIDPNYVSGLVDISMTAAQTILLPVTKAVYDVRIYASGGFCAKVLKGYAEIYPSTNAASFTVTPPAIINMGQIFYGTGAPAITPPDPTSAAFYYDINTLKGYLWNPVTQSW